MLVLRTRKPQQRKSQQVVAIVYRPGSQITSLGWGCADGVGSCGHCGRRALRSSATLHGGCSTQSSGGCWTTNSSASSAVLVESLRVGEEKRSTTSLDSTTPCLFGSHTLNRLRHTCTQRKHIVARSSSFFSFSFSSTMAHTRSARPLVSRHRGLHMGYVLSVLSLALNASAQRVFSSPEWCTVARTALGRGRLWCAWSLRLMQHDTEPS